jgi:SAM-dependent methyltransferase
VSVAAADGRVGWERGTQERAVEALYGRGVERYGDYHHGYLNFGLWDPGVTEYVAAAENMVRALGERLGLGPGSRLADAAPGMGAQDVYLARRFGPIEIDAVDATYAHVVHARRKAREAGLAASLRVHHGSATAMPLPDGACTHVMSLEAAHHFDTRERFFGEGFRVLAPGGAIALADFTLEREPGTRAEAWLFEATCRAWRVPRANAVGAGAYAAQLERQGFRGVSIEKVGARTFPGYYAEQRRPERRRRLAEIRGFWGGRVGHLLDVLAYRVYEAGLVEYVLVRAEKPG